MTEETLYVPIPDMTLEQIFEDQKMFITDMYNHPIIQASANFKTTMEAIAGTIFEMYKRATDATNKLQNNK
jgi:hypothetical protein